MWTCKRCETRNEESNSGCSLCGTLRTTPDSAAKQAKAEPQMGANYRYAQSAGQSDPRTGSEEKAGKAGGFKILAAVLFAFLAVAVGVIVFLVNRAPAPSGELAQATQQDTAQTPADAGKGGNSTAEADLSAPATQTVFGNVTLTVESTCDYSVNLIPSNLQPKHAYIFEGLTYDTNQIRLEAIDESILTSDMFSFGMPIPHAQIQLYNRDDQKYWDQSLDDSGNLLFTELTPGTYYFTVTCEGYDVYTSTDFEVFYETGKDNDVAWTQACLNADGSTFSEGFQIQLTDMNGIPVEMQSFAGVILFPCLQNGSSFSTWTGQFLGKDTDQNGMLIDSSSYSLALKKGSMAIITFDGITTWDGNNVADQYILIRAEK